MTELDSKPDEFRLPNSNYILLGYVIERVTGTPIARLGRMQESVAARS